MANILTLSGASEGIGRAEAPKPKKPKKPKKPRRTGPSPTADLKVGQCMCILNTRTNNGVSVCRVPPGETRNNLKLGGKCPNPLRTK